MASQIKEGLFCYKDAITTYEPNARFCRLCGQALSHHCPSCGRLISIRVREEQPLITACPHCNCPVKQCKSCYWITNVETKRCVNPICPDDSLSEGDIACSQLGGDSGRTNSYRITGRLQPGLPFLADAPDSTRVILPGVLKGVAAGINGLWAFTYEPGSLWFIHLPQAFNKTISKIEKQITYYPHPKAKDPIAVYGRALYLLTNRGAVVRRDDKDLTLIQGEYVSQCLHPRGWLLVERREELAGSVAYVHRMDLEGNPLKGCDPYRFPERKDNIEWTLPVADDTAAYVPDGNGRSWRFAWDGESPSPIGNKLDVLTTLLCAPEGLYSLPVIKEVPGQLIDREGNVTPLAKTTRQPLMGALTDTQFGRYLWLNSNGAQKLVRLDRDELTRDPVPAPGSTDTPVHACTLQGPGASSVVVSVVRGANNYTLRAWESEEPFFGKPPFPGVYHLDNYNNYPLLVVSDPWLACWYALGDRSEVTLYYLR